MLAELREVQDEFISHPDTGKAFNDILAVLLTYAESEFAFIGEVLYDAEGQPYLKSHALTNIAWNEETRRLYNEYNVPNRGLEFRNRIARQKVEAALKESEERHRLLYEGSRDAMMMFHPPEWHFTSVNPAMVELFQIGDGEGWRQIGLLDLSPQHQPDGSESNEHLSALVSESLAQGSRFLEWEFQRRDGSTFPATLLLDRLELDGQPFIIATVRDITLQKQAQMAMLDQNIRLERLVLERTAQLVENERFLRASIDALSSHIAVIDGDGRLVASNVAWQHFAKKIGIPEECVVTGSDYLSCCDEAARRGIESAGQLAALLREIIQGKYPSHDFEFRCPYSDDEQWFLTRVTRFPGNGPVRVVIAHENITSIKVSQRQVEQSQQEFQNLFEFAPDATLMVDADGIILRVNRQLEQVFDYSRCRGLCQAARSAKTCWRPAGRGSL